jgi:16S rRNA G1207 methylase RsmC
MGTDHYFSPTPPSGDEPKSSYRFTVEGRVLTIATDRGVFARKGLDAGTEVLLDAVPQPPVRGNLLDLGCGTGAIALTLATRSPEATVHAIDVNPRAVELCRLNAQRNGLSNVSCSLDADIDPHLTFDVIWSNPPIRIGKEELHRLLATWLSRLSKGATAWLVVNRNLGADSLSVWLSERGCNVDRATSKRGFRVLGVTPTPEADLWRP